MSTQKHCPHAKFTTSLSHAHAHAHAHLCVLTRYGRGYLFTGFHHKTRRDRSQQFSFLQGPPAPASVPLNSGLLFVAVRPLKSSFSFLPFSYFFHKWDPSLPLRAFTVGCINMLYLLI